jgi:hypothetical protein
MTCGWNERGAAELRFYGELEAADAAAFDAHLPGCEVCRASLDELKAVVRALDGEATDAPAGGDWADFMDRLDRRLDHERVGWYARLPTVFKVAAMVTLVTAALLVERAWERGFQPEATGAASPAAVAPALGPAARAVASLAEQHLQRSKLVLLGLVAKDAGRARPADWRQERELASAMLADTSQYRLTAAQSGLGSLADVLGDLEVVLLQTSLSDSGDPGALTRIQKLIDRRDLLVKIEVIGVIDGPHTRPTGNGRLTRTGT